MFPRVIRAHRSCCCCSMRQARPFPNTPTRCSRCCRCPSRLHGVGPSGGSDLTTAMLRRISKKSGRRPTWHGQSGGRASCAGPSQARTSARSIVSFTSPSRYFASNSPQRSPTRPSATSSRRRHRSTCTKAFAMNGHTLFRQLRRKPAASTLPSSKLGSIACCADGAMLARDSKSRAFELPQQLERIPGRTHAAVVVEQSAVLRHRVPPVSHEIAAARRHPVEIGLVYEAVADVIIGRHVQSGLGKAADRLQNEGRLELGHRLGCIRSMFHSEMNVFVFLS